MARSVFYSFHYDRDSWRVNMIRNMGVLQGQPIKNSQDWEKVKQQGDAAVKKWIDEQMLYKEAVVVLVGAETSTRPWVRHEIIKAWNDKRALVGIYIHGLEGSDGKADRKGANPFAQISLPSGGTLADFITVHDPIGSTSQQVHRSISDNLESWVAGAYKRR